MRLLLTPLSLREWAGPVQDALASTAGAASPTDIARTFGCATAHSVERIEELLETLATLGKARQLEDGRYVAV